MKKLNRSLKKQNEGQLLLIAGITLSISIITLSSVAVNLSSISLPVEKSLTLKSEYDNIRKEFGIALKDNLKDKIGLGSSDEIIKAYFNDVRNTFVFYIESFYDVYFDAELDEDFLKYYNLPISEIRVTITLSNEDEYIKEVVSYYIY